MSLTTTTSDPTTLLAHCVHTVLISHVHYIQKTHEIVVDKNKYGLSRQNIYNILCDQSYPYTRDASPSTLLNMIAHVLHDVLLVQGCVVKIAHIPGTHTTLWRASLADEAIRPLALLGDDIMCLLRTAVAHGYTTSTIKKTLRRRYTYGISPKLLHRRIDGILYQVLMTSGAVISTTVNKRVHWACTWPTDVSPAGVTAEQESPDTAGVRRGVPSS